MNKEILPVLDEISAVLKKHDMAGLIIVGNKTHCDFRMDIAPSWSCAWFEEDASGKTLLRVRSKSSEYPDRAAQKEKLEQTIGTFVTFDHIMDKLKENLAGVLLMLSRSVDFMGQSRDET